MKNIFRFLIHPAGVLLLCALFTSCASNIFTRDEPVKIPEDFFGISPDRSPLNPEDFELLDDFNASWIRSTIRWSGVEKEEGVWDFSYWDEYVEKAERADKKVILILGFDNGRLYKDNKEHRAFTERELPYFLQYVEQVVSRYRLRVVYEIWNEPNFTYWDGTDRQFFTTSAAAARKIREIEPNAVILAGSTAFFSKGFTRGMFTSGAMENTDGFSLHPYGITPAGTVRQIEKLIKVFDEFDYDKPVWVTEVGYSTGPISICNIKRYPEYIVKTLCGIALRADRVNNMLWFELMDDYNPGEVPNRLNPANYFGLIYPNRTFKPGAHAFMLTATSLAGSEYRPELPIRENISNNVTSLYFVKEDGTNILILWKSGSGKQTLRLAVPDIENISCHDINDMEIITMEPETILEISRQPVFITWKGGGMPRLLRAR
jgi:hypothetical protein